MTTEPSKRRNDEKQLDNYAGACVPTGNDDVNCADVQETDIHVVGKDPYGLDGDGDGTACESPY